MSEYRNPTPTVDVIIEMVEQRDAQGAPKIVLIERKNEPRGWALPGGFVDEGEPLWRAAAREVKEETGLEVELVEQFYTYSAPGRDPRLHTVSTVYLGRATGEPAGSDDAADARLFGRAELPEVFAFDHRQILDDFFAYRDTGARPGPER